MKRKRNQLCLYGTLGPCCHEENLLFSMFTAGMTGVRLNLSHRSLPDCRDWLLSLYQAAERKHIVPDLLVDLQGPELRIGILSHSLSLQEEDIVLLTASEAASAPALFEQTGRAQDPKRIPIPAVLIASLQKGMRLKLDDGKILLEVEDLSKEDREVRARVLRGGVLVSKKSIAAEKVSLALPVLTSQDRRTLRELASFRVTGVMLPFVRSARDLITLKKELLEDGMDQIEVFAKIETKEGVENLPELMPYCDEIVIARGDLGNAVPLPALPAWQKRIALTCRQYKKPFMVVTQMLASMEHSPVPTRAEVTDIFQAVLDGASSLMLTGETAVGDYPLEAMRTLSDTAFEAQRFMRQNPLPFSFS